MVSRAAINRIADQIAAVLRAQSFAEETIKHTLDYFRSQVLQTGFFLDALLNALHGKDIEPILVEDCSQLDDQAAEETINSYLALGRLTLIQDSMTAAMLPRTYHLLRTCGKNAVVARKDTIELIDCICKISKFGTISYKDAILHYFDGRYPQVFVDAEQEITKEWHAAVESVLPTELIRDTLDEVIGHFQLNLQAAITELLKPASGRRTIMVNLRTRLLHGKDSTMGEIKLFVNADGRLIVEPTKFGGLIDKRPRESVTSPNGLI